MPRKNNNHPKITVVQDALNPNLLHKVASCGDHRVYGTTWDELLERARGCFDGMVLKAVEKFVNAQKFIEDKYPKPMLKSETVRISLPPKPMFNIEKVKERLLATQSKGDTQRIVLPPGVPITDWHTHPDHQSVLHERTDLRVQNAVLEKKKKDYEIIIDNLTTKIWDLTDKVERSQVHIDTLELNSDGYRQQAERLSKDLVEANSHLHKAIENANRDAETKCKRKIAELTENYNTAEANRKYACEHVYQQNEFIREAKELVAEMKAELTRLTQENTKLTTEKVNAEHLATQLLRLQAENVSLMGKNGNLTIENDEFKKQTTRLLNEATKYACTGARMAEQGKIGACGAKCGVCLSCQLAQAKATMDHLSRQANDAVKSNEQTKEDYQKLEAKLLNQENAQVAYELVTKQLSDLRIDFHKKTQDLEHQLEQVKTHRAKIQQDLNSAIDFCATQTDKYEKAKKNWNLSMVHSTHLAYIIDILRGGLKSVALGKWWNHKTIARKTLIMADEMYQTQGLDKPMAWEPLDVKPVAAPEKNFCNCDAPSSK